MAEMICSQNGKKPLNLSDAKIWVRVWLIHGEDFAFRLFCHVTSSPGDKFTERLLNQYTAL